MSVSEWKCQFQLFNSTHFFNMYSKDELSSKDTSQLLEIAEELGVKVKSNTPQEDIIYAILDQQAIAGSAEATTTKRKRTRIAKKDTDHVYSVNGSDGENLDTKKPKTKKKEEPAPLFDLDKIKVADNEAQRKKEQGRVGSHRRSQEGRRGSSCSSS